ncbi:hypothetical protein MMC26_000304 [Xylographa opegraphella]|nr:hypothetical protein [Xylographa opegraphella]
MCLHTTHTYFTLCAHLLPIPQLAPFFIPPERCHRLTAALRHYHTQPDRLPEQFPIPFPHPCAPAPDNCRMLVVQGLCGGCAEERWWREREWFAGLVGRMRVQWEGEPGRGGRGCAAGDEDPAVAEEWPYGDRVRVSPLPSPKVGPGAVGPGAAAPEAEPVGAWWVDGGRVVGVRWDGARTRSESFRWG